MRDFYEGGMILFDPQLALQYERRLRAFLLRRKVRYLDDGSRRRMLYSLMVDEYNRKRFEGQYRKSDYHPRPGDPLIGLPDVPEMLWLKRRKLRMLEMQAFKLARRRPWFRNLVRSVTDG